jgi:Kef-type K+ transport system membrane component KefB
MLPLALLFLLGGASYVLAHRVRIIPGPLFALLGGALLGIGGPLGNLLWSTPQVLPPEPLNAFRVLGAVLLMWGAGVEMEVAMLRPGRRLGEALLVGVGGALASAALTWGAIQLGLLGSLGLREQAGICLLSAASAIPVLLAVVASIGRLNHPLTRTALTAALLVDLVIIGLIPLVNAEGAKEDPIVHLAKTILYLALMIALAEGPLQPWLRRAGRALWGASPRTAVVITLGFGLTVAVVAGAQQLGVELLPAALGWGIGSKPLFFPDAEEAHNPFFDAFFPFEASYFALAGAMLDLRLVTAGGVLLGLVAILGKIVGGLPLGARGLRLGTLLVPRGAVDLVLAVNLLVNGVLTPSSYTLAVTMIAVTTIVGALMARLAFRGELAAPSAELERLRTTR